MPIRHAQAHARRDDIDVIGLYSGIGSDLTDRHFSRLGEKLCQLAVLFRVKVLNQHKRHAGIGRQMFKKRRERFQSAGRCADADHREWRLLLS